MKRVGPPVQSLSRALIAAFVIGALACVSPRAKADERLDAAPALALQIDALLEKHWQKVQATPAAPVGDVAFLRRVTLDLAGRIPTEREATAFAADSAADKRDRAIRRLMEGPEYPLHMGRILDDMIQGKFAGDAEFLDYLRRAVAEHRGWDQVFREVLLGPWEAPERKGARRFLSNRVKNLDDLTNDTAVVFFGVNISCAKCHDHPLVEDWKQDHYFGMASFFNPTYEGGKGKSGKNNEPNLAEKTTMPVAYVTTKGERRTAKLMFLSGQTAEDVTPDPKAPSNRREQLVRLGLEEKAFFSKAIVNRLWAYLMGTGIVNPVDQMHSANKPAVAGLLDFLADDLATHNYDLDRLMAALVSSRVYQLDSVRATPGEEPSPKQFAIAPLRPLTPAQYALSLVLATGDGSFDTADAPEARAKSYRGLEGQAGALTGPKLLDPRSERFQSSASEALYLSNNSDVQKLVAPTGSNLAARLAAIDDTKQLVATAVWTVLGRAPAEQEREYLVKWLGDHKDDRPKACGQLVWALLTSAEFRFNH